MRKPFLLFLFFLSGCALIPGHVEVLTWPSDITFLQGEGDLDILWGKERHSGSFFVRMEYPDALNLEVYGPFGQTLLYLKKEPSKFLFIAGEEKATNEAFLREKYGFSVEQLMDGLAMKGRIEETTAGGIIRHEEYQVAYGQDRRGRRTVALENPGGRVRLTFTDMSFVRE